MNGKKAKAMRRAFNPDGAEATYRYHVTAHPYVSMDGGHNVRYRFCVVSDGWRRMYKIGKLIYRKTGVLPNVPIMKMVFK